MTSDLTAHEVRIPGFENVLVRVGVPATWVTRILEEPLCFVARMPEADAGPFADNLIVNVERLGEDAPADFEELQGLVYAQAFSSVPDFYAVDDRPFTLDGEQAWFRASLQTAPPGITAVSRQVFTRRGGLLVTFLLTTMAFRDREASDLFEKVVGSCSIAMEEESA